MEALRDIGRSARARVRFPTGEVLRRAGLVDRETSFVVAREYANQDGVWPQWRGDETPYHEWWLTPAGRLALENTDDR